MHIPCTVLLYLLTCHNLVSPIPAAGVTQEGRVRGLRLGHGGAVPRAGRVPHAAQGRGEVTEEDPQGPAQDWPLPQPRQICKDCASMQLIKIVLKS